MLLMSLLEFLLVSARALRHTTPLYRLSLSLTFPAFSLLKDFTACDLLFIVGTSLAVHPFAGLIDRVQAHVPRVLLNREIVRRLSCLFSFFSLIPRTAPSDMLTSVSRLLSV